MVCIKFFFQSFQRFVQKIQIFIVMSVEKNVINDNLT